MALITPELLMAIGVSRPTSTVVAPLLERGRIVPGDSFNTISSRKGIAMLVGQLGYESKLFEATSESLSYSVSALREGNRARYFSPEQAQALGYLKSTSGKIIRQADQRRIANLYYGSRLGNLGANTDDGWIFRGAGWIQLTGRYNHTQFGLSLGKTAEQAAVYLRTPEGACAGAFWYWRARGLLIPASRGDVVTCTALIQGADDGLATRRHLYNTALDALGSL